MLSKEEQEEYEKEVKRRERVLTKISNAKQQINVDEEVLLMFEKYKETPLEKLDGATRWCVVGGGYNSVGEMLDGIKKHILESEKRVKKLCLQLPDGFYKLNDGSTILTTERWKRAKKYI